MAVLNFIIARSHSLTKIISVYSFCHLRVFSEIERWKEEKQSCQNCSYKKFLQGLYVMSLVELKMVFRSISEKFHDLLSKMKIFILELGGRLLMAILSELLIFAFII